MVLKMLAINSINSRRNLRNLGVVLTCQSDAALPHCFWRSWLSCDLSLNQSLLPFFERTYKTYKTSKRARIWNLDDWVLRLGSSMCVLTSSVQRNSFFSTTFMTKSPDSPFQDDFTAHKAQFGCPALLVWCGRCDGVMVWHCSCSLYGYVAWVPKTTHKDLISSTKMRSNQLEQFQENETTTPWCESWGLRMTYLARSEVSIYTSTVVFSTCRLRAEAKKSKTKQTISKLRLTLPLIFKSIWVHILERETQYKTHEKPLYIKQYTVRTITQMTTKNQSLFIYLYDSLCMSKSKVTIQKDSQIHLVPVEPFGRCESVRHLPDLTCRLMVSREFWRYKSAWNNRTFREQDKVKITTIVEADLYLVEPLTFSFCLCLSVSSWSFQNPKGENTHHTVSYNVQERKELRTLRLSCPSMSPFHFLFELLLSDGCCSAPLKIRVNSFHLFHPIFSSYRSTCNTRYSRCEPVGL